MLAAQDVAARCKEIGITALHIKMRATGGTGTKTMGPGGQSALRALARAGMRIGRIEVRFCKAAERSIANCYMIAGRHTHAIRHHTQKGWSTWSSFVDSFSSWLLN